MKVLLNPVIICLLLAFLIVCALIFFQTIGKGKVEANLLNLEKNFTFILFAAMLMNDRAFIGNLSLQYLGSHVVNKNASLYIIIQLIAYALVLFLLRSRIHYLFKAIIFLFRDPFLVGLLVLSILSSFWSETPFDTFKASLVLLGLAIYASIVAVRCSFQELTKYFREFGAWVAISSAGVQILLPSFSENGKDAWQGITGHPNVLGPLMALNTVLWCLNAVDRPKQRGASISLAIISSIVMMLTNSSGSKVIFVALISLSILFRTLKHLPFRQASAAFLVVLTCAIPISLLILDKMNAIFGMLGRDQNLTGRGEFWPAIIDAIDRRLFFGYGFEGFWQSWRGAENPAIHIRAHSFIPTHSHNGFFELALALGLVGIILFALSFFRNIIHIYWLMYSNKPYAAEISLLISSYIIFSNLTEAGLWSIGYHSFIYILLSVRNSIEVTKDGYSNTNSQQLFY
jgi:exopolysaccharide production protein ExoQ